ncbi:MAG: D-alanyl-D-alanine carboxypeptidase [Pseudomonadota bacterium]
MINKKTVIILLFFFTICETGLSSPYVHAKNLNAGIALADEHGRILYSQNFEQQFVPASILKILTSLTAIHILGEHYHFSTDYYFDKNSKNLYIKGYGDPLFTSEVIQLFCQNIISTYQIDLIHNIVLDQTYFSNQIEVPGKGSSLNPYDAPVGALCANFNTIMFKSSKNGNFISAESQTPLLSIFQEDIKKTGLTRGRIILTKKQSQFYPGLLIKYFLEAQQIKITGDILQGSFPENSNIKKHTFLSPFDLKEVVQKLLKYSNNFIANQLLLIMGAKADQPPATIEKGLHAINKHLKTDDLILSEGSGLSRSSKISPKQMLKILLKFMPYHSLLNKQDNDFYKTGTLTGIRTRAGYILGKDARLYPYVIMINQKNTGYIAIHKKLFKMVNN